MMATVHLQEEIVGCDVADAGQIVLVPANDTAMDVESSAEFKVVYAIRGEKDVSFDSLGFNTRDVYIVGRPTTSIVNLIIKRAPNVKTIRIASVMQSRFYLRTRELCEKHGIEVDVRSSSKHYPRYSIQRSFFLRLIERKRRLFSELLRFELEEAKLAERYFCLNGEKFVILDMVANEFGLDGNKTVCRKINGLLYYLDSTYYIGEQAKRTARGIKIRVGQKRREGEQIRRQRTVAWYANRLGVHFLPTYEKRDYTTIYKGLWYARRDGRLALLRRDFPLRHRVLTLGFGMVDRKYHTQQEVADMMVGMTTRAAVSELQREALRTLGIES